MAATQLAKRAATVRLLVMDADGTMTDGSINIDDRGRETKRFNVRDGLAMEVWRKLGFEAAIITGRSGGALRHRARELKVRHLRQGEADKAGALAVVLRRLGLRAEEAAYLGDDWSDLCAMNACGYAMAVADAEELVKKAAVYVTARPGGHGAVRDAVEHLLRAKGMMRRAQALYDPRPARKGR